VPVPLRISGFGGGVARARGSRPRRINVTSSRALSDAAIWRLDLPRAVNVIRLGEKFSNLSGEIAAGSAADRRGRVAETSE